MLVTTWLISIYIYNTVVWTRDVIINHYLVAMQCVFYIFVKLGKNKIHSNSCHHPVICTLQVVGWVQTAAAFSLTNVLCHLVPDQSIQSHPEPSLSPYHVCNMSQQSIPGKGHAHTWDANIHTQIPAPHHPRPLLRTCRIDNITPRGAALTPPGYPPSFSSALLSVVSLRSVAVSLPIRPSCHSSAVRKDVRQLHCLTPGVDTGRRRVMEAATYQPLIAPDTV